MILRSLAAVLLYSILCFACTPGSEHAGKPMARALSRYDDGGSYELYKARSTEERNRMLTSIRAFLWDHWHKGKRGRLSETSYTYEGVGGKSDIFVEPDANGKWQIVEESQITGNRLWRESKPEFSVVVCDTIERVRANEPSSNPDLIPDNEVLEPTLYKLRISNSRDPRIKGEY